MLPEKLRIDHVDGRKVIHVLQEDLTGANGHRGPVSDPASSAALRTYRYLDDLPNLTPAGLDDIFEVL